MGKEDRRPRSSGFGHGVARARGGIATSAVTSFALVYVGLIATRDAWAALVPALFFSAATVRQTAWLVQGYRHDAVVHWRRSWSFFWVWIPVLVLTFALCFTRFDSRLASDRALGCAIMTIVALLFAQPRAVVLDGGGRFVRESWLLGSKRHPLRG